MSNTPNAEKKTLILTGASRGIGHATVKRFASAGWRVITCSRHAFPENCPWEMGPEDHIQVDLADPADTLRAIGEMRERLQGAGQPPQRARQQCRHLAQGPGRVAARRHRDAARGLAARVPGQFLRADHAGARADRGAGAGQGRGGQRHLHRRRPRASRSRALPTPPPRRRWPASPARWRRTSAARGIRVNAISPGEIDTAILSPGTDKIVEEQIPLGRLGEPEEVAKAIYFLCTEQSSYVNGAELHINGGQHV